MVRRVGLIGGWLLAIAVAALVAGSVGVAQAAPGSTASKYYAVYKIGGSFSEDFSGMTCCGYSQTETAHWTYKEKFGPFSISQSTAKVKTSSPTFGGGWTYQERSSDGSSTCDTSGNWNALNFPPTMKSTEAHGPGFDGVLLVLTAGPDPLGNYFSNPSCQGIAFFGSCGTYIGGALAHTATSNCDKAKYFTTDLSVSDSGLKHKQYVYHVSNTRKGSEQVSKDCNQAPAPYSCAYSWSGTVTFEPAG